MATQRTVADLVAALERGTSSGTGAPLPGWPRSRLARLGRALLQQLVVFPYLRSRFRPLRVRGGERPRRLAGPVLIVANHSSHLDALTVLAMLPAARRGRTAVAAAADYFFAAEPLATGSALVLGAFPFHRQGAVSASLAHCGDLVDAGYSILIFPEGTRSPDGRLQPFKSGIGLLARELGVPVLPVRLEGLHAILPKGRSWPGAGPVTVSIGEPIRIDPVLSNAEAAAVLEAAVKRPGG
jgi:long-chain acyl-CoA synthetase